MKRYLLFLVFFTFSACAATSSQQLQARLNNLITMQAKFQQIVRDEKGNIIDKSSGKMAVSRPGKFSWETIKPLYQLIVADGVKLWIYDRDLEQVTVRPQKQSLANTPALFLSGDAKQLEKNYRVSYQHKHFILNPKDPDNHFQTIELWFKRSQLTAMRFEDQLGHHVDLTFSRVKVNTKLSKQLFHFIPPKGVDVVQS